MKSTEAVPMESLPVGPVRDALLCQIGDVSAAPLDRLRAGSSVVPGLVPVFCSFIPVRCGAAYRTPVIILPTQWIARKLSDIVIFCSQMA